MYYDFSFQDIFLLFPFLMYAELHYKPKYIFSRYFIKEPEILADCPFRIDKGADLPILLLIKDSDKYPIKINHVVIDIHNDKECITSLTKKYNMFIKNKWWHEIIKIKVKHMHGAHKIIVKFNYEINGNKKDCLTHNYPNSKIHDLKCYFSNYLYPRFNSIAYGDLHYHTNLTDDMVEFGAPMCETLKIAESMGIDFVCNTDHSYDLDDKIGSWFETDPNLIKWKESREEISKINKNNDIKSKMIPSEELSLHNCKHQNIHALILNNSSFLPGYGDGGENLFHRDSIYDTSSIYNALEEEALCIAAHPFVKVPLLEKLIFKRGQWTFKDIIDNRLCGFQILNGKIDHGFKAGLKIWKKMLLMGYYKYIYAGNDAHGNFNNYRQIKIPMINILEREEQIFGNFRTGIYGGVGKSVTHIISKLRRGNCFLTNGPCIEMLFLSGDKTYHCGEKCFQRSGKIKVNSSSTPEFGLINQCIIYLGTIGNKKEKIYKQVNNISNYKFSIEFDILVNKKSYIRLEINTNGGEISKIGFAMTNPIWICDSN